MVFPYEPKLIFLALVILFLALFMIALLLPYTRTAVTLLPDKATVIAEIADNPVTQARGLMFREKLEEKEGILFVFGSDAPRSFWMMNTLIPLDLLFISKNLTIVDIKENFEPCKEQDEPGSTTDIFSCPRYVSKPAAYVLEVNAGFVKKHGIKTGDRMKVG